MMTWHFTCVLAATKACTMGPGGFAPVQYFTTGWVTVCPVVYVTHSTAAAE